MQSEDAEVQAALLEIAKDLLEASDSLAETDPEASAKLAQEAYEIAKDLGIVQQALIDDAEPSVEAEIPDAPSRKPPAKIGLHGQDGFAGPHLDQRIEEESDIELFRILDRQREILPGTRQFPLNRASAGQDNGLPAKPKSSRTPRSRWWNWVLGNQAEQVG